MTCRCPSEGFRFQDDELVCNSAANIPVTVGLSSRKRLGAVQPAPGTVEELAFG